MRSSSSDEEESDPLFPTANESTNTLNLPPPTAFASELSPPTSQDPPDQNGIEDFHDDSMDLEPNRTPRGTGLKEVEGHPSGAYEISSVEQYGLADEHGRGGEEEQEPGYAWNNKKARDEYHKAMEFVVDKNFSLRKIPTAIGISMMVMSMAHISSFLGEYGDPFNDRKDAGDRSPVKTI